MKFSIILILLSCLAQVGLAAPFIAKITKSAMPGDVVGIHGDRFGGDPEVWIDHLEPGDHAVNREQKLTVLSKSEQYLAFRLPTSLSQGVYAVTVKSGDKNSTEAWINRAEPWHCLDLAGKEITPGFVFRIAGRNLAFDGATPSVRLIRKSDGAVRAATEVVSVVRGEIIQCKAPSDIVAGEEYHVEVNNGLSTINQSWSRMPGELLVRAVEEDPFDLGVPWGSDFSFISTRVVNVKTVGFWAVGDGVADDRLAIQRAIDLLSAAGGGVVYLPAGVYKISSAPVQGVNYGLILKSNVVIQGDGIGVSTIMGDGLPTGYDGGLICAVPGMTSKVGLTGLSIKSGQYCSMTLNYLVANRAFITNCRLEAENPNGCRVIAWREGSMSLFKDSQFVTSVTKGYAPYFFRQKDFMIKNCLFEFSDDRMDFVLGERVQLEESIIARGVNTDAIGSPEFGGLTTPSKDFTLMNTTFTKVGTGNIPQANDGESVLCEYPSGHFALSKATGSSNTTLTDATASWVPNAAQGLTVTIIRGPGAGQQRVVTGNTSNQITVDQAWSVNPVAGESVFSVNQRHGRHLIIDNLFMGVPRGIWYYRSAVDDVVIANNNFVDTPYPILIRASQRVLPEAYGGGNEFNAMTGIFVVNNSITQSSNFSYPEPTTVVMDAVSTTGSEIMGNFYYDCVMRDNVMRSLGNAAGWGLYLCVSHGSLIDVQNFASVGVIAQRNLFQNFHIGININTGNRQTILKDNEYYDVNFPVMDQSLPHHLRASVGTVSNN